MLLSIFRNHDIAPFQNTWNLEKNSRKLLLSYAFTASYSNLKNITHKLWDMSEYSCFPKLYKVKCHLQCNDGVGLWEVIMP